MDCIFCKIASGEIAAQEVYRDETAVAFRDLDPKAPVHILVIPVQHVASVAEFSDGTTDGEALAGHMLAVCARVAREHVENGSYRVVTNVGPDAGQSVQHLHFHVLGGRHFGWPPG